MNVTDFLKLSENISVPQIYKNLATLKCEEEEIESFKKFIPVLVDLTYAFLHSLDNDRIIFAKQAYEDLKAFIKTIDIRLLESEEFKKLIHQWENATNYHLLYMPHESFVQKDEDVMSKDDVEDESDAISKWKRISKFKKDVQNRLDNSNDINKQNFAETPKKSAENQLEKSKDEINDTVSPSDVENYGLKLLLLALQKLSIVKSETKIIFEEFINFNDIVVLETDVVDDLPIYSIFSLLIYQNDGAQILTRQLVSQRSNLSVMKYFCIFNELRESIKANQIKMFCLHTNAAIDVAAEDYFNSVFLPVIFDQKPIFRRVLKNDESVFQMLRSSVDMNFLVDHFVKHIVNSTKRNLNSPILALYRDALINENVIDKNTSQFHARFLDGISLSDEANNFRQKFIDAVKETYQFNEEGALIYMKNIVFTISNYFYQDEQISCYKNFKIFSTGKNICREVNLFVEKFALAVDQPNEVELNDIIELELVKSFLLFNAKFISSNTVETVQCMIKEYRTQNNEKNSEILESYISQIQQRALASPLTFSTEAISTNLDKKLLEFMNSNKVVLVVKANIPYLTEILVKRYLPDHLFITSSMLHSLYKSDIRKDLLLNNHLIARDDGIIESFSIENLHKNLSNMEVKTKTVVIVPKENFLITEKTNVDDKTDFCIDLIDFSKWLPAIKVYITEKTVEFQNKKVMVKDLIKGSEELITPHLIEKLFKDEKIKINNNQKFCDYFSEETYIPRMVWKENGYNPDSYSEKKLIGFDDNPVIIVGSMGLGKTTLLTKLSKDIMCNKEELFWVVVMDLNDYCNLLDTMEFCDNMDNEIFFYKSDKTNVDFAEVLLRSMLTIPADLKFLPNEDLSFELKLFKDYFYTGNLYIVVDGFGEIPKCYRQKILHFLEKLVNDTNNKLIISTTPEFQHLLEHHLCSKGYILKLFTEEEREKFVKNYWISKHGLSVEKSKDFYADFNKSVFLQTDIFEPHSPLMTWITAGFWLLNEKKEKCSNVNKEMQLLLLMLLFPGASNSKKSNFHPKLNFPISFKSMQLAHYYKSYQRIALKQLLHDSVSLLELMLSELKEDFKSTEESILDNVEDFLFLREKNGKLVFIHSMFAEYFAATFLFDNLNSLPQKPIFDVINYLLQKTSKSFCYYVFELFPNEWYECSSHLILFDQKLLLYSVTENLESIVKYLIRRNHKYGHDSTNDELVYFDRINLQSTLENSAENYTNLLEILLQPFQLENNEEHLVRKNKFLTLQLTDYVPDFIMVRLLEKQNYKILKDLIFARKKISYNIAQMKSAPKDFQTFTCSIGFIYDFDWTMSVIKSDKEILSHYYDDYSLDTDDSNTHIQITPREILKKLITPQYTPLDLINKSHYYSDEEKLELTKACINAGGNTASWSHEKGDFDENSSYIICILQASIAHGHFKTFKYFLKKEKIENYSLHLLTAAKFSQSTIIHYLLNYHCEAIIHNKDYSFFKFMELLSNDELKFNMVYLHFPIFKQEFINPYKLIETAAQNPSKLIIIKKVIEQCQDERQALADRLAGIALGNKRHEIPYYLCLIFNLNIPEASITFHNAVKNGDCALVAEIINKFDNINEQDDEGNTPLHFAGKNVEIVRLLLKNGAIYNSLNKKFKVPIESVYAATDAYDLLKEVESAFRLQIQCYNEENIASIFNARNLKKQTLMHVVLETGSQDEIKHVIETYFNKCRTYLPAIMNSVDLKNNKPLHIAVRTNNFGVFKKLLEYGALFDETTKDLINAKLADERKHDRDDKTLEFKCFLLKYENACKSLKSFLKEHDKDVTDYLNCKDENGKTPMHYAVESDILDKQMVKTLIKLKANFNIVDNNNFTPLDLVIKQNDKRQYLILVKAGIKLNGDLKIKGIIPECDEFYRFYKTIYEHILNHDVNGILKVAKAKKKFKQFLLANVRDTDGNTLLHHAVKHNSIKIILFLLQKGVPFNVTNRWGNSAENLTTDETIKSILQAIKDLFYAVESRKTLFLPEMAKQVFNNNFVVNKKILHHEYIKSIFMNAREQTYDNNIYNVKTLLHQAVKHGTLDIVRWVITNGAGPLAKDFYHNTALQIAKKHNHIDVIYFLQIIKKHHPVQAYTLCTISKDDQKRYLFNVWKKEWEKEGNGELNDLLNDGIRHYAKELLHHFQNFVGTDYNMFMRIPLKLKMMAEIFKENEEYKNDDKWFGCFDYLKALRDNKKLPCKLHLQLSNQNMNLFQFYNTFVKKKIDRFLIEKIIADNTKEYGNKLKKIFFEYQYSVHRIMGFLQLTNEQKSELLTEINHLMTKSNKRRANEWIQDFNKGTENLGIVAEVIDNIPIFDHLTYAEYFCACFLMDHLSETPEHEEHVFKTLNILLKSNYPVFQYCILHLLKNQIDCPKPLNNFAIFSAAITSIEYGLVNCVKIFAEDMKCEIKDCKDKKNGKSLLHYAVEHGNLQIIVYILFPTWDFLSSASSILKSDLIDAVDGNGKKAVDYAEENTNASLLLNEIRKELEIFEKLKAVEKFSLTLSEKDCNKFLQEKKSEFICIKNEDAELCSNNTLKLLRNIERENNLTTEEKLKICYMLSLNQNVKETEANLNSAWNVLRTIARYMINSDRWKNSLIPNNWDEFGSVTKLLYMRLDKRNAKQMIDEFVKNENEHIQYITRIYELIIECNIKQKFMHNEKEYFGFENHFAAALQLYKHYDEIRCDVTENQEKPLFLGSLTNYPKTFPKSLRDTTNVYGDCSAVENEIRKCIFLYLYDVPVQDIEGTLSKNVKIIADSNFIKTIYTSQF